MPAVSGMVFEGQDPETRINNVITSASWIPPDDMSLVNQGKQQVLDRITNESWVAPYVWRIRWINIPPQEAQQSVATEIEQASGAM